MGVKIFYYEYKNFCNHVWPILININEWCMYVLISSLPSSVYNKMYEGSMYYYAQAVIIKLSNLLSLSNNV